MKITRGFVPSARQAPSTASVPCRFTFMPRSKSASAAAETTAAKWKTTSVPGGIA